METRLIIAYSLITLLAVAGIVAATLTLRRQRAFRQRMRGSSMSEK